MEVMEWHAETIFPEDSYQGECGTPACILGRAVNMDIDTQLDDYFDSIHIQSRDIYIIDTF